MTFPCRLAPEAVPANVLAEQKARQTALAAQLNADPRISKLGHVEVVARFEGNERTDLRFLASGGYEHCVNANFYDHGKEAVQFSVLMVTRNRGTKKYHDIAMLTGYEIAPEGVDVIAKQLKSGLTKFRKAAAEAAAAKKVQSFQLVELR